MPVQDVSKKNWLIKLFYFVAGPFQVLKENTSEFVIWFLFTIVMGQLGVLVNIIIRYYSYETPMQISIYLDSISGSFYIFSIATVASMLGPLFINFLTEEKLSFKKVKIFTTILTIFLIFFAGIIYSVIQSKVEPAKLPINLQIDFSQVTVYIVSLLVCVYIFCILKMENTHPFFKALDEPVFSQKEDKKVANVILESKNVTNEGEIKL